MRQKHFTPPAVSPGMAEPDLDQFCRGYLQSLVDNNLKVSEGYIWKIKVARTIIRIYIESNMWPWHWFWVIKVYFFIHATYHEKGKRRHSKVEVLSIRLVYLSSSTSRTRHLDLIKLIILVLIEIVWKHWYYKCNLIRHESLVWPTFIQIHSIYSNLSLPMMWWRYFGTTSFSSHSVTS